MLIHTVKPGDTLAAIAASHDVPVYVIINLNSPPTEELVVGQTLVTVSYTHLDVYKRQPLGILMLTKFMHSQNASSFMLVILSGKLILIKFL